jgi:hypothetical protein
MWRRLGWLSPGLVIAVALVGVARQDQAVERGGTLILAIPVREGLVLCGDRWITDQTGAHVGEETKIKPVGERAAVVMSGRVGLDLKTNPPTVLFDAHQLTEQFLKDKDVETADWEQYQATLRDALQGALEQLPFERWPESRWGNQSFLQVLIFYIDRARQLQGVYVRLQYQRQQPPMIDVSMTRMIREQFAHALPIPIGNQRVYREIESGHAPAFDDLRRSSFIQRFIRGTLPVDSATSSEAISFARIVIRATSTRARLLPGPYEPVGPDCDCFVLSKDEGLVPIPEH